jgi:NAD(P)-dependent dehydrogenase (short-subunit alcohol dehydrogenase family)
MMSREIHGSIAVVTGGASGIGFALAKAFGRRGASVLIADLDPERLGDAVATLTALGVTTFSHAVDVRDSVAVRELADRAASIAPIAAVCLNAGVSQAGPLLWETPSSAFDFVLDVNARGLFNSISAFIPKLLEQDRPADVVVTASAAGLLGLPNSGVYAASKAAAVSLAKTLRGELAAVAPDLRVAMLAPGMVKTNLQRTSASLQPADAIMDASFVEMTHDVLNSQGADPETVAEWVLDALAEDRFWVLPPSDDVFMDAVKTEVRELRDALGAKPE